MNATRELGELYVTPEGIGFSVQDIKLTTAYTYEGYDGETRKEAPAGMQWAFIFVTAENGAGEPLFIPSSRDIVLLAGNRQYDSSIILRDKGEYQSSEIQPGVVRSGWIAYEIPDDLSKSDLRIIYSDSNFDGDWRAEWEP